MDRKTICVRAPWFRTELEARADDSRKALNDVKAEIKETVDIAIELNDKNGDVDKVLDRLGVQDSQGPSPATGAGNETAATATNVSNP